MMERLIEAINAGDVEKAQLLAQHLASSYQAGAINVRGDDDYINVRVFIEDREASGPYIFVRVKPSYTVRDLKYKMMLEHNMPAQVQCWIVGHRILTDDVYLSECGIERPGFAAHLYLRSAEDLNLQRGHYEDQCYALFSQQPPVQQTLMPEGEAAGFVAGPPSESSDLAISVIEEKHSIGGLCTNEFQLPAYASLPTNFGYTSATPPRDAVQCQLTATPPHASELQFAVTPAGHQERGGWSLHSPAALENLDISDSFTYPTDSGESLETNVDATVGWVCPACTFFNQPTRPGCEMCTHERP